MKLAAIVMLSTCMATSAHGLSQQVTITETNAHLEKVFAQITKQTGYTFFYEPEIMDISIPVSLQLKSVPLNDALKTTFKDQPFTYKVVGKIIAVKRKDMPADGKIQLLKDKVRTSIEISGKIVDDKGQALGGATIVVKGKNVTVQADMNGTFTLHVDERDVLIISFVGFETREYKLSGKKELLIVLQRMEKSMDTSVVVYSTGFQHIAKERATGSFVQIDNKTLSRTVSTNILDRLYYATSGLRKGLNGVGGGAGNSSEITIRGISTVRANQKPLIIVDGFPYEEDQFLTRAPTLLANLNPNDVESVTVLKDAAATSIWGARSANGVIVINTKNGKFNQKPTISLSSSVNYIERPRIFKADVMSSKDVIEFEKKEFNEGRYNDYDDVYPGLNMFPTLSPVIEILLAKRRGDLSPEAAEAQLKVLEGHDVRHDMKKYLMQPAINQQYNLSVSGGSPRMRYYGSIGFDMNRQSTVGNYNDRLTLNLRSGFRPVKNLEITAYINYTQFKDNGAEFDVLGSFLPNGEGAGNAPYLKFVGDDGSFLHVPRPNVGTLRIPYLDTVNMHGLLPWHYNPVEELQNTSSKSDNHITRFGASLNYSFLPGMAFEITAQNEYANNSRDVYNSMKIYETRRMINALMYYDSRGVPQYPVPLGGIMDIYTNTHRSYNLRAQLNISRTIGMHEFNALAGGGINQVDRIIHSFRLYGFDPNTLTYAPTMDFVTLYNNRPQNYSGRITDPKQFRGTLNRELNYYSNIGYTLNRKYNLTASFRVDGSNYMGVKANQRFRPLWSAGGSWLLSKENFFHAGWVNSLNLRITYGYNGNMDNSINTLPVVALSPAYDPYSFYNNEQLIGNVTAGNPGLTWERSGTLNLAVDFMLFNNRLGGSIDYYYRNVIDLISNRSADATTGITDYTGNIGHMRSKGVDIRLMGVLIDRAVKWTTDLNVNFNREKLVDYYAGQGVMDNAGSYLGNGTPMPGKPLDYIYSYRWAGLDHQTGDPIGVLQGKPAPYTEVLGYNANWELNVKPGDLKYHGSIRPLASGNILSAVSWKEFTFSCNITYAFGFYFRRSSIDYNTLRTGWSGHGDYARRWQKPGDEQFTSVPSFGIDNRYNFYRNAEVLVRRGDYIYLQDANLLYDASKLLKNQVQARIFINAKNLGLLWTANKEGTDPNTTNFRSNIPVEREVALGINLNL